MRLHVEALFAHDPAGRMVRVNELDGGPAPRLFLGRTARSAVWRFRHDVSGGLADELRASVTAADMSFDGPPPRGLVEALTRPLAAHGPVRRVWAGPAFVAGLASQSDLAPSPGLVHVTAANADLLARHFAGWIEDPPYLQPFFAVVEDRAAVSICTSVRRTDEADEAGVETAEAFRGRGHAGRVVAAWAAAVRQAGRVPLYSTSWENRASSAVAAKLGLRPFGSDLHIT